MKLPHILTGILTLLITQAQSGEPSVLLELPKQLTVNRLPAFSARDKDANQLFTRRHLEKLIEREPQTKRVALVYFATWCAPCAQGAVKLKAAKETLEEKGILTVFVNAGEKDIAAVHKWIKEYGVPEFPLIMDTRLQLVGPYGLLEPNGTVIMPKTLVLSEKLKPLFLLGTEGDDFPEILWKFNTEQPETEIK
jgi:thiol-disulfide isomerase/thioredoxin